MTRLRPYLAIIVAVIGGHLAAAADTETDLLKRAQELFQPLPPEIAGTGTPIARARAALGRLLFFDPRLTIDGNVSCSTCHQPARCGTDGLAASRASAAQRATMAPYSVGGGTGNSGCMRTILAR